jgi:ComF family protein
MPPTCLLCLQVCQQSGGRRQDICLACLNDLPILPQTCARCAKTFLADTTFLCGECLKNPPPYDAAHALFSYQKPITKLIMELKFHERLLNARILGELMANAIQQWYANKRLPDTIIPMPLHSQRLKERGFNQALEIARPIAKLLRLPLDISSCIRVKATIAQARLPAAKRAQNMHKAFYIRTDFNGRHLAILDDVTTTGHSINALARALKRAGNPRIDVWCCARTLPYF